MIIISPFAKQLRGMTAPNPKNYPYWESVIQELSKKHDLIQVGIEGEKQLLPSFRKNLSIVELTDLVKKCDTWISVDSFFQHLGWYYEKPGVVLWGQSDPNIFGHPENANLLKSRKYLREKQFWLWEQCEYKKEAFVDPIVVIKAVNKILHK